MQSFIVALGIAISVAATLPYLSEIIRGNVKPRLATWFIWSLLSFIGAAAAFTAHQIPAGAFTLATAFEAEWIVLLGFKKGDRSFDAIDVMCIFGALGCLVLLLFLKSPGLTILATVLVDLVGSIPTLRHSWERPYEENWLTYALFLPAEALILLVADFHQPAAFIFPLYLLVQDALLTIVTLSSPNRKPASGMLPTFNWRSGQKTADATGIGNINPHLNPRLIVASTPAPGLLVQPALANPVATPPPPPPVPATAPAPSYLPAAPAIAPGGLAIISPTSVNATLGAPFDFRVIASGNPAPTSIQVSGRLPTGFAFTNQGDGTAKIAGTAPPGTQGGYPLSFTATSPQGTASQPFLLTVT